MNSNIMSLGGIAIAIGAMVDAAIVMIENAHKHSSACRRAHATRPSRDHDRACKEVGPALFFSLLIITVSFLPVFTLEGRKAGCSRRWPTPRPSPWPARRCCR
jgi:Cu(I)/Ag(I) efflux system membrane protein CusA/SilA